MAWIFFDGWRGWKPSAIGACVCAVVGPVAITLAAGHHTFLVHYSARALVIPEDGEASRARDRQRSNGLRVARPQFAPAERAGFAPNTLTPCCVFGFQTARTASPHRPEQPRVAAADCAHDGLVASIAQ
ncbi:MAG: hypothetical protein ACM3SQ_14685 [Betaproteobacteria bacterium]